MELKVIYISILLFTISIVTAIDIDEILESSIFTDISSIETSRRRHLQVKGLQKQAGSHKGRHNIQGHTPHLRAHGNAHVAVNRTSKGLFILPVANVMIDVPHPWGGIPMPNKSYFAGFEAPNDELRWNQALMQASRGEQVLLSKVLEVIKSPLDLHQGDKTFKWVHKIAEHHKSKDTNWLNDLIHVKGHKAPIVMLGFRVFDKEGFEGHTSTYKSMGPNEIIANRDFRIPRKIVAIGNMDENWGWGSTYFLNRTVPWAMSFDHESNPYYHKFRSPDEQLKKFLNDPNLVMLAVNQHHNLSHPKVISLPLGVLNAYETYETMKKAVNLGVKKDNLFYSAGSNYGFRPAIRECIAKKLGSAFTVSAKVSKDMFGLKLVASYAVLAMPGLGYDTYRHWETLASGSMPVVERGMGMDRTFYKLPVLLLDDFFEISETMLRQAYAEALYRANANEWEYERMTKKWWERLLYEVSEAADAEPLQRLHPISPASADFTRPLVPYNCVLMGGCGPGAKRTPPQSCAIDPSVMSSTYNWAWNHHNDRRLMRRLLEDSDDYVDDDADYTKTGASLALVRDFVVDFMHQTTANLRSLAASAEEAVGYLGLVGKKGLSTFLETIQARG